MKNRRHFFTETFFFNQESDSVHAYIPQDTWYEFPSGVHLTTVGQFIDLDAPIQKINVHVRGGIIIPMQIPGSNLILGRGNPFQLLVASSSSGSASGNLYWDDGDSIGIHFVFLSINYGLFF